MVSRKVESLLRDFYSMLDYYRKNPSSKGKEGLSSLVDLLVKEDPKYTYLYTDIALLSVPPKTCV